jgi:hypothetical protein
VLFTKNLTTVMAEIWHNEPIGGSLAYSCFRHIHSRPYSTCSVLPADLGLSSKNLLATDLRDSISWSAPFWLSNLGQILDGGLRLSNDLHEVISHRPKTTSLVHADTFHHTQTNFLIQPYRECAVAKLSKPTKLL